MTDMAAQISEVIKQRMAQFDLKPEQRTEGTILNVQDGIARVYGLDDAMYGEMLEFEGQTYGLAFNLEQDCVGAVIMGAYEHLREGQIVRCTGRILEVPVGEALLGRVVDAMGQAIDGRGPIESPHSSPIEKTAPGVITRQSVSQSMPTGIRSIDAMVPIGRGQRELIIGDRQTGKTAIAIDTILNQKTPALNVFMWPSVKKHHQSRTWCVYWNNTARWNIPQWWRPPRPIRLLCNLLPLMRVVRWVNISAIVVKMR